MASLDIPTITVNGIPTGFGAKPVSASDGNTGWVDNIFGKLEQFGSAYLDFELQKQTLKNQAKLQEQYGTLYQTPGTLYPTGAGVNYQGMGMMGLGMNTQTLLIVGALGVGLFVLAKA